MSSKQAASLRGASKTSTARMKRESLAARQLQAFRAFSKAAFSEGALSSKTKELIAVAVAHVTQCPHCIRGHTIGAASRGATDEEIMEAIWVASEMRAGAAYAHSLIAMEALTEARAADT